MMNRWYGWGAAAVMVVGAVAAAHDADAGAGTVHLTRSTVTEQNQTWRLMMSIALPSPPPLAHPTFRFVFTPTMVYERSMVDGDRIVSNKVALRGQTPSVETMEVDFADPSGKIWKATKFDFSLTRERGYLAGEYRLVVRGPSGEVGAPINVVLEGENPVVDRRSMDFTKKATPVWDGGSGSGIKSL